MKAHFRFMFPNMRDGVIGEADYKRDVLILGGQEFSLSHARHVLAIPYDIQEPESGWKKSFTYAERARLRPIAETLAMLDGNAFFGMGCGDREWFEHYLPEAHALYEANGGDNGWAGKAELAGRTKPQIDAADYPPDRPTDAVGD